LVICATQDNMTSGAPAAAAAPPPPQHDQAAIDRMLAEERERHEEQLKLETRAREELEDMILRIEKHFKAEQVGGRTALPGARACLCACQPLFDCL